MARTLLSSVYVFDPTSKHHGKTRDVLLDKGKIVEIAAKIADLKATKIKVPGMCISPGWIDLAARFCDPGEEFKEDLHSGALAAKRGGFKRVVVLPNSISPADSKSQIEYITRANQHGPVTLLPAGSLSAKGEGKQLAEMADMATSGAVAFTDDKRSVSTELMTRALDYARNFGGLVFSFPMDLGVVPGGLMHEGAVSTSLGMKGIPHVAEELRLMRDISLLRYTGGELHVSLISTANSVNLIREAKEEGLNITCAVAAHQLCFTHADLQGFDSNLKVMPPFRTEEDLDALIEGLADGTIDAIVSDHTPEDTEHKDLEFEDANFGMSSIQTTFHSAYTALENKVDLDTLLHALTTGPASVLGVSVGALEAGCSDYTVFSLSEDTRFDQSNWASKSKNSPYFGSTLRARIYHEL
jgi:dihydroorotase